MIITHVTGNCTSCGGRQCYGNCLIRNNCLVRGCAICSARETVDLPPIRKKILYLDQCFLSSMFLNDDPRIKPLASGIKRLIHQQQLVTPYSCVHEAESLQWGKCQKDELFQFIRSNAIGHPFNLTYSIWNAQLYRAFQAYLTHAKKASPILVEGDALPSDIHNWDGYVWVDCRHSFENPEATECLKKNFAKRVLDEFPKWRQRNCTYEELYSEVAAELVAEIKALFPDIVRQLCILAEKQVGEEKAVHSVDAFLKSSSFRTVPFVDITITLYAKLRQKIQNPALYTNLLKAQDTFMSFQFDVEMISTYGPYCDAMVWTRQ